MITQKYNLNLIPDKVPVQVNCSQYDALSRTIEFTIYDGAVLYEIPSGTTATVRGTKSDNTGFEYPCTIDGSTVSFDIQDQMTIFNGRVPCEIRLTNNGILGTCNFCLNVEPTPLDPDVTISDTYLPLLEDAEQNAIRAEQAADQAESLLSSTVKSVNNVLPDANGNVNVSGALPAGGTAGQILIKQSSAEGDATWNPIPTELPSGGSNGQVLTKTTNGVAWDDADALPTGGTQGQVLTKLSSTDGDADWEDIDALPTGGTQGQVLTKQSSTDGDADWEDIQALPSGGTTGQYLVKSSATEGDADWQTKEVELTQAQYDALPSSKLTDGVSYYITDGESAPSVNKFSASGISYDNTNSGLSATNVQSAIDEVESAIDEVESDLSTNLGTASFRIKTENQTSFTFEGLNNISNERIFKHGLLVWGTGSDEVGLSFVFIHVNGNVSITNLSGTARTFTGSVSNGILTITGSSTMYGGVKLIWLT